MRTMQHRLPTAATLLVLVPLFACEPRADTDPGAAPPPTAEPAPAEAPAPAEPGVDVEDPDPAFAGTTSPTTRSGQGRNLATIDDVRSSRRNGYDRVVFQFREGTQPGHEIRYGRPPFEHCASGEMIEVDGNAFLIVTMQPAAGRDTRADEYVRTAGSPDRRPELHNVRHIRETCDYHGGVTWVIGLEQRTPYRVLELEQPARLVVDISTGR